MTPSAKEFLRDAGDEVIEALVAMESSCANNGGNRRLRPQVSLAVGPFFCLVIAGGKERSFLNPN